ncbi:MAG: hypothetical protein A2289_02560 [Deltaproteobacteria bacterium RIFOXYA12_FULL_58_15]|nr:MAG: hypothetical protein A2289_02560 [Deltaproteobacteria bacterium RIFOXYA12_FULL_58_15]OGR09247.1 MAG: hypothetical protein A2341_24180 [Deltaproteobacteria bacterium RIFOXYB12_FULL_58_9]
MRSLQIPISIVLLTWLCNCGTAEDAAQDAELSFSPHIQWSRAIDCPNAATLGLYMNAAIDVDGHNDLCPLDVNTSTLAATGDCDGIRTGDITFVGLDYFYVKPSASRELVSLLYTVGWVDLRAEALDENTKVVEVDLSGDTVNSLTIDTQPEFEDLGTANCSSLKGDAKNLCNAEQWANEWLRSREYTFDLNQNGTANLEEACTIGVDAP